MEKWKEEEKETHEAKRREGTQTSFECIWIFESVEMNQQTEQDTMKCMLYWPIYVVPKNQY